MLAPEPVVNCLVYNGQQFCSGFVDSSGLEDRRTSTRCTWGGRMLCNGNPLHWFDDAICYDVMSIADSSKGSRQAKRE